MTMISIIPMNRFKGVYFNERYKGSRKKTRVPTGLSHDSQKEIILEDAKPIRWLVSKGMLEASDDGFVDQDGNLIDLDEHRSEDAIVYVHGFRGMPRNTPFSKSMFEFLSKQNRDIYAPMMRFHGMRTIIPLRINPYLMFERLKKDIEFIMKQKYRRIHFVVFSHGALQTIRASIEGLLDERSIMLLLCPQLMTRKRMTLVKRGLFWGLRLFVRDFFKFEDEVLAMLQTSSIKNDFVYILGKKDIYVSPEIEQVLRIQQRCVDGMVLPNSGHFVTMYDDFYTILGEYLNTIL